MIARHSSCLIMLLSLVSSQHNPLGPGSSLVWEKTPAEQLSLSSNALKAASAMIQKVGTHQCLTVVKDGALIVDDYYDTPYMRGQERPMEAMSAAKTVTAALMGAAVQRGLFDIDVPIAKYGVKASKGANWTRTGTVDYFPNVTARHLLSQTSGVGLFEPGTAFTYDSDEYIQHLSYLLTATAGGNQTAREWATTHFAEPLGIPNLYSYEGPDPAGRGDTPLPEEGGQGAISAGGDMPMLCRDLARVGLLLANGGLWADDNGTGSVQLADPHFVQDMFQPQFASTIPPNVGLDPGHMVEQYSFLAEVTTNNSALVNESACDRSTGGEVKVLGLPDNALVGLGLIGKYLIIVPSEKLVVVAFGSNLGRLACEDGTQGIWTNEESVILSEIWRALGPALQGTGKAPNYTHAGVSNRASTQGNGTNSQGHRTTFKDTKSDGSREPRNPAGSCYCYCGYFQAIGRCFNTVTTQEECGAMHNESAAVDSIEAYCPHASLLIDCFNLTNVCPPSIYTGMVLDPLRTTTECPAEGSAGYPQGPLQVTQQCHYKPVAYDQCFWIPGQACVNSPYFPAL